jgi:hypothetical protein
MRYKICFLLSFLLLLNISTQAKWGVGAGAYVPFGLSTQKDEEGGTSATNFQPSVFASSILPAPLNHLFLPELGLIFYRGLEDDYSKRTLYLLGDVGYKLNANLILRYGIGLFSTSISSDGGAITLNDGAGTSEFYKPSTSVTSYNVTWNLGIESALNANWSARFETFLYEALSSVKRDVSYTLNITYYL